MAYKFDSFIFDGWNLSRDGVPQPITDMERQLLLILVKHAYEQPDAVMSVKEAEKWKKGLRDALWPGYSHDPFNDHLAKLAHKLRKLLDKRPDGQPYIRPRVYLLNATVVMVKMEGEMGTENLKVDEESAATGEAPQLWRGFQVMACVISAALFAAIAAAAFKWLPGTFGWALTQASSSAGMGTFQGLTAGVIWAGTIVLGLTLHNFPSTLEMPIKTGPENSFWNELSSYLHPFSAIVVGALCGFISSFVIILVVVSVFEMKSLEGIGWIMAMRQRGSWEVWQDLFINTRFALPYLITGTCLGIGMAMTKNGLFASAKWSEFVKKRKRLSGFKQMFTTFWDIMRLLGPRAWPILVMQLIGGALAFLAPQAAPGANELRAGAMGLAKGLIGDCATQALGAFFGIAGMGLGIVIIRWSLNQEMRRS